MLQHSSVSRLFFLDGAADVKTTQLHSECIPDLSLIIRALSRQSRWLMETQA